MLNARQELVASSLFGRVVVVAGPGSGKTKTLVERVRRHVAAGVHRSEVVACTFTVRAAGELEDRLGFGVGYAGTIHGLAHRILTSFPEAAGGLGSHFSVLDGDDRDDLLRDCHAQSRLRTSLTACTAILDALHAEGGDPEGEPAATSQANADAATLLRAFRERKARLGAEDFDGLVDRARLLLLRNPLVAESLRKRWRHWSVDEAQDLDGAQDSLLELLCPREDCLPVEGLNRSILLVGDPMQSIYAWRGARPEIFLGRLRDAHVSVTLGRNYRSAPQIVELVNAVAADDPDRPEGYELDAERQGTGVPAVIVAGPHADDEAESVAVAAAVQETITALGAAPRDVAVLARTNAVLQHVAAALTRRFVPFQLLGERRDRMRQPEIRGAIAHAQLALNAADDYAFCRAASEPRLATSRDFFTRLGAAAKGRSYWRTVTEGADWLREGERAVLDRFVADVASIKPAPDGSSPSPFGWSGPLDDLWGRVQDAYARAGLVTRAVEIRWLRGLLGDYVAGRVPGRRRTASSLASFVWWLLFGQGPNEHDAKRDAVTLSTVHLAKGLEWRHVFVPGLTEGGMPTSQARNRELAGDPSGVVEERRVFFVAASRAADSLVLSHARAVHVFGGGLPLPCDPSRFLGYAKGLV